MKGYGMLRAVQFHISLIKRDTGNVNLGDWHATLQNMQAEQ